MTEHPTLLQRFRAFFRGGATRDTWSEADHPRADDGKFGSGGGGSGKTEAKSKTPRAGTLTKTFLSGGKRTLEGGAPLPEHIQKLKIPPAWTEVAVNPDPAAPLQVVGRDAKGRQTSVYSEEFSESQARAKFERVRSLAEQYHSIEAQNAYAQKSDSARTRDAADCLSLIMKTGLRPGSESDTGAEKKAYGATNLQGRHVVKTGDGVRLQFTGKKGVDLDIEVGDPSLGKMLLQRAKAAGDDGAVFPSVNEKSLLEHVHKLGDGSFKTKDFRTHLGTKTAAALVEKLDPPATEKDRRAAIMQVAKEVSKKLGNTPVIALQSYINPTVFARWSMT